MSLPRVRQDENREKLKQWHKDNKEKRRGYHKVRRNENIQAKIGGRLRSQMGRVIRRKDKKCKSFDLLGCSIKHFVMHLESQFQKGMSWDNYGVGGWHIDHIYPCSGFDLTDIEEQKICFNWTNMQPLWEKENLRKNNKITCDKPDFVLEFDKPKQSKARAKVYKMLGCKEG